MRKHKDPITGNSFIVSSCRKTHLLTRTDENEDEQNSLVMFIGQNLRRKYKTEKLSSNIRFLFGSSRTYSFAEECTTLLPKHNEGKAHMSAFFQTSYYVHLL